MHLATLTLTHLFILFAGASAIAGPAPQAAAPVQDARAGAPPVKAGSQTFNTVITKLKEGKQVFSNTIVDPDLAAAKKACEGQDFIWIECSTARSPGVKRSS